MQDKKLVKELINCKNHKMINQIILINAYPNYFRDPSYRIIKRTLEQNKFNLLTIRNQLLGKMSVYTEVAIKTGNELTLKKISPQYFNQYFKANWIEAILLDNIASLIGVAHLPTITLFSLDEYIKDLKKI